VRPVDLVKPPQQIFRSLVYVIAAGVVREVVPERRSKQFLLENVDLIQEENDTRPDKPSRVHDRIEQ
jgi:hypothetical protein